MPVTLQPHSKEKIKGDGHWDSEAELFFAAVEVANACRNVGAHAQAHVPKSKSADYSGKKLQAFNAVAAKHGRNELHMAFVAGDFTGIMETAKHYIRLATYANNCANEYVKLYGQN